MMLFAITFYILFSLSVGMGVLKHEYEINKSVDIWGTLLYPLIWPFLLGVTLAKIVTTDVIVLIDVAEEEEEEELEGEEKEEQIDEKSKQE
jgi:hypothetical protein